MFRLMSTPNCSCFSINTNINVLSCSIWSFSHLLNAGISTILRLAHEGEARLASYVWGGSGRPLCGWTPPGPFRWRLPLGPRRLCWAPAPSAPRSLAREQVRSHDPKLSQHRFHLWDLTKDHVHGEHFFFFCLYRMFYNLNAHKRECPHY